MTDPVDPLATVLAYHERTKHHPGRFARSRGFMDWESQPDPFRRYPEAPRLALDEVPAGPGPGLDAAWDPAATTPRPVDRGTIAQLLYDALALSAWKQLGTTRWSLRVNPSSGNLHPTEGYLVAGPIADLTEVATVAHYSPWHHGLERLRDLTPAQHRALLGGLPQGTVLVGLTSIPWREAWKYGERAYRYCQHDVGHALAALAAAAALLGWRVQVLPQVADTDLAALLGTDAQTGPEAEHPDALVALWPQDAPGGLAAARAWRLPPDVISALRRAPHGLAPAPLGQGHHPWPIIEAAAAAVRQGPEPPPAWEAPPPPTLAPRPADPPARQVIRGRRSAMDMDGETPLPAPAFYRLLAALLPGGARQPHAALPWSPGVHPVIFVHRVTGLAPGIYLLQRDETAAEALREDLRPDFAWDRPPDAPPDLPLFQLEAGDVQALARAVSCQQDIASDGAFAVAFLARFAPRLAAHGPWAYRALHWEAGALGQVLYLEAEAAGLRGTGIGCFFDDEVHRRLGLTGKAWQILYHFTVGRSVEDPRLTTLPAYFHRDPHP